MGKYLLVYSADTQMQVCSAVYIVHCAADVAYLHQVKSRYAILAPKSEQIWNKSKDQPET